MLMFRKETFFFYYYYYVTLHFILHFLFLYLFTRKYEQKKNVYIYLIQDCKKAVSGKSFYAMEGLPVCPGCVGVDEED
jgi:hypothetical protein